MRRCRRGHRIDHVSPKGKVECKVCKRRADRKYHEARRKARLAERRRRIAGRRRPSRTDRIWAAGHFEGEGTFSIMRASRGATVPLASLSSTDWSMVEFFHERWPGNLFEYRQRNVRARKLLTWRLYGLDKIEGFILDIRPFLRSERVRTKAALLLEDVRARAELRRDPKALREKAERHRRMRALNRRGVQGAEG